MRTISPVDQNNVVGLFKQNLAVVLAKPRPKQSFDQFS